MEQQRDVILCAERLLLHTLGFHFHAEHPYTHLLRIVKQMSEEKVIPEKNARDLAQVAWNFANDRYILIFDNIWAGLKKYEACELYFASSIPLWKSHIQYFF